MRQSWWFVCALSASMAACGSQVVQGDVDGGSTPDAAQSDAAPSDSAVVSDAAVRDGGPRPPADVLVPPSQDAGPPLAAVCERACERATNTCGGSLSTCVRDCNRAQSSLPPACLSVFTDAIACIADRGFVCGSGGPTAAPGCEMYQQALEDCATTTDPPPMIDGGVMPPPPMRDGGAVDAGVAPYCAEACAQIAMACGGSAPTNCTSGCSASATMYSASCPAAWDRYVRCLASPGGVVCSRGSAQPSATCQPLGAALMRCGGSGGGGGSTGDAGVAPMPTPVDAGPRPDV